MIIIVVIITIIIVMIMIIIKDGVFCSLRRLWGDRESLPCPREGPAKRSGRPEVARVPERGLVDPKICDYAQSPY